MLLDNKSEVVSTKILRWEESLSILVHINIFTVRSDVSTAVCFSALKILFGQV